MKRRVQYLTVDDVVVAHEYVFREGDCREGILMPEKLEASVMAAQATFGGEPLFNTLADVASAYVQYIASGHAFVDGNKRTATIAMIAFLDVNGFVVTLEDQVAWANIVVKLVKKSVSREEIAELIADALGEWGRLERR